MSARLGLAETLGAPHRKLSFHVTAGVSPTPFYLFRPTSERSGAPLVVSVHGIARNAAAHAYRLMEEAERFGLVVVAPLFEKARWGQYQQLEDRSAGARSDLALLDLVAAAGRISGAQADRFLLFGFSGGAQFANRFCFAHPERVASAILAAAGWYTAPDTKRRYPYGLAPSSRSGLTDFNLEAWAQVPHHVLVGDLDVERDSSLRQSPRLDQEQGPTRVQRARRWVDAANDVRRSVANGRLVTFRQLPNVGHSFAECVERAGLSRLIFETFGADCGLEPFW